jgi:hypothetical protein
MCSINMCSNNWDPNSTQSDVEFLSVDSVTICQTQKKTVKKWTSANTRRTRIFLVRVELPLCTPYCYKYGRKDCLCHGRKFDSRRRAPLHLTYQKRITDYLLGGPRIHYFCKIIILRCIYPKSHKLCNISSFGQFSLFYC